MPLVVHHGDRARRVALNGSPARVQGAAAEERGVHRRNFAHQLRTALTVPVRRRRRGRRSRDQERLGATWPRCTAWSTRSSTPPGDRGREGLHAKCDAAAVVRDRVQFWRVLAEDQGRAFGSPPGLRPACPTDGQTTSPRPSTSCWSVVLHAGGGVGVRRSATTGSR